MDLGLGGKRALVTGSTADIGCATRTLAFDGAEVILNGRTEARVSDAAARLKRESSKLIVVGLAEDLSRLYGDLPPRTRWRP